MKILYYSPHPHLRIEDQTGYGTHMREMIAAFKMLGHNVDFLIAGHRAIPAKEMQGSNTQSLVKEVLKFLIPRLIWETIKDLQLIRVDRTNKRHLNRLVNELHPDVIYERSHYGMVSGVEVANIHGIHHILEVNCPNVEERIKLSGNSLLTRRATHMDRWAFSNTDHVLTVSAHLAKHLEIHNIAKKWSVTANAIRLGQQEESTLNVTRHSMSIDESTVLLGFVGSIFPWHGVDLIVDAVANFHKKGRNVEAMIVGDGEIRQELKEKSVTLGVKHKIHFVGSVPQRDTFVYTQLCDILIMPKSNAYGSPVKIFEYALSVKPCIVPNTSPVTEVFEHEQDGWVVDSRLNAIVSAIESIIDSPEDAKKCANNWCQKVTSKHTWTTNASIALDIDPQPIS